MLGFGNRRQTEQDYPEEVRGGYQQQGVPQPGVQPQSMPQAGVPAQAGIPAQAVQGAPQNPQLEAYINKRAAEIDAQVRDFSRKNPDFDIRRELRNPKFCNYLWGNGLSVEDAYYLAHREDERRPTEPERRISENGTSRPGGSGMVKKNPEDMSDEEVDDIIRRVRKGEKISF